MKRKLLKLIMLFALIIISAICMGQSPKQGKVDRGANNLRFPINFTLDDSIDASETYLVEIDCNQLYAHTQSVALTIDSISGAPSLSISLEGRTSALDDYTEIVSAATWNEEADNPFSMVVSTANKYRYFKIKIVASGATQKSRLTALTFTDTYQNTTSILATTGAFSGDVLIGQTTANETTPSLTIKGDADSDAGGDTNESIIFDLTPNATPTLAVWDVTSTQSAGYRFDKSLAVGLATPNETLPVLSLRGDADSDAADVTEVLSVELTPNATPTSATWGFTSTQSAGYTFDKAVTSGGLITGTAGVTITGAAINLNASSNFATNIGTGSTNAAISIGGGSNTVAINSTALDISTAGAVSGATTIANSGTITTTTDADTYVVDMGTDLHAIDVTVNSASKFSVDTTGNVVAAGVVESGYRQPASIYNSDGTETLDATMSGKTCVATKSDGATTITLPDPVAATVGVMYYLVQTADQNLVVTCTTADNNGIVCDNVVTSDAVTISTAGHLIGAGMFIIGIQTGAATYKWYVGGLNPESVLTPEAAD